MRRSCWFIAAIALAFIAAGCSSGGAGGSAGGGGTSTPPPPPSFTVSLSPASVTLNQGGSNQSVQVTVTPQNGFSGSVSISVSSLPSGVTLAPSTVSFTPGTPGTFTLSAGPYAQISQQIVNVTGTSGTLTTSASLQLNVTGSPVPDPFHLIGGSVVHGFYDENRQLLFATNPGLNEVDVISGQDFSIKARIPVPSPWGIDQMADGKTLVIGTQAQEIITLDEDTYAVTQHPYSAVGGTAFSLFFPDVIAMANGKVLVAGLEQGIEADDIYETGEYLFEWNSNANTFTQIEPSSPVLISTLQIDSLARSADHKWAVFAADQFYLYSSDSDSLTSAPLNTVNPPDNSFGVRGYALNSDGSKIAVVSANQVTFLDHSLSVLASTPIPAAFQTSRSAVEFSPDGQKLFLEYAFPLAVEEIDANAYIALGYVSATVNPDQDNFERLLATDSQGCGYLGIDGGLRVVNLSQPPVPNPSNPSGTLLGPACPQLGSLLPLNTVQQEQIFYSINGVSIYVGGRPAPLLNGGVSVSIPASSVPGPGDIECIDSYGDTAVTPEDVSYGVVPLALSGNLLPSTGGAADSLFSFGLSAGASDTPSVTIEGQAVSNASTPNLAGLGVLQATAFQVPGGVPGQSADVGVTSSLGSATLPAAATYYNSQIIPASGLLQLTFDTHRNLLYALKANEVDVLDAATLKWNSPLTLPATTNGAAYTSMALSPDGSWLVVAAPASGSMQLAVFDLNGSGSASVFNYTGAVNTSDNIVITNLNQVIFNLGTGQLIEFDLTTSTFSLTGANACGLMRASADGSHLYGIALNNSSGGVCAINPSTFAETSEGFGYMFWTDLAVSPDGSQFAAVNAPPYADGDIAGFFNSDLQYLNDNQYPSLSPPSDSGVLGPTFSPGGKVLAVPLGNSIELWDANQGTLRARVMTPEELHVYSYPEGAVAPMLAIDSIGQNIFAVSASGITVITLPEPMDQTGPGEWPLLSRLGKLSGYAGSIASRMRAMRSTLTSRRAGNHR